LRNRLLLSAALAATLSLGACAGMDAHAPAMSSAASGTAAQGFGDYLSARMAASRHDLPEAAKLYRASLEDDPTNPELLSHAFLYTAAAGDVGQAAKYASQMVQNEADNRGARLALAVDAMKHGDYAGARTQVAQSGKGPFTALTLSLIDAWAAVGLGNTQDALKDLQQVPNEGGTEALSDYHRALILDLAGQDADADASYRAAIAAGNTGPRIIDAYGRFLERTGRTDDARAFYTKLAGDEAAAPIANAGLARLASGTKPDRLISRPADGAAEALFGIAASLTDQTSADVAILYLRFALYMSPDFDLAKIVLADRFEALEKYEDAIAVYRSVNMDSPYGPAAAVQVAVDQMKLDHNDQAIDELTAFVAKRPHDISAWTSLGDAYRAENKFDKAAEAYDHAVQLIGKVAPKDWPLFYARAVSEEQSHHWDLAEADLENALKLSPEQPQVLNYLGYTWVDQNRKLPEALAMLEKARALSPYDGYIVDSVGWAYYRLGRYPDAAKTLENAVLLVPADPTINDHLGDAYWRVGRKLDARFQWNHALAFDPDKDEKTLIEKKLADGLPDSSAQP
jgi:tetratricopeptide (TPR) repeat protein